MGPEFTRDTGINTQSDFTLKDYRLIYIYIYIYILKKEYFSCYFGCEKLYVNKNISPVIFRFYERN
jgi:hypothetical protein